MASGRSGNWKFCTRAPRSEVTERREGAAGSVGRVKFAEAGNKCLPNEIRQKSGELGEIVGPYGGVRVISNKMRRRGGIERRRRREKGRLSTLEVGEPEQLEAGSGEGRKQGSGRPKRDKAAPLPNRALD